MKLVTAGELKIFFIITGILATLAGIVTFLIVVLTAPPPEEKKLPPGNPFFDQNPVKVLRDLGPGDFKSPAPWGQLHTLQVPPWTQGPETWTEEDVKKALTAPEKLQYFSWPEKAEREMEVFLNEGKP